MAAKIEFDFGGSKTLRGDGRGWQTDDAVNARFLWRLDGPSHVDASTNLCTLSGKFVEALVCLAVRNPSTALAVIASLQVPGCAGTWLMGCHWGLSCAAPFALVLQLSFRCSAASSVSCDDIVAVQSRFGSWLRSS